MPLYYNTPFIKDALTGEMFEGIRVGTFQEKRLLSCSNSIDRINQNKLFFGPLDNRSLQIERFEQFIKRENSTENILSGKSKRTRRKSRVIEINPDQEFPN